MSNTVEFVIARYNEDITWLTPIMNSCIIYNKGQPLHLPNEIPLKNVGRESDTYLHHVIMNYDNLKDVVVFTQANIADHRWSNDINYLKKLANEAADHGKALPLIKHKSEQSNLCGWDPEWNGKYRGNTNVEEFFMKDNYKNNKPILFRDWFKANVSENYPDPIYIYPNALFAVRKEKILRQPKKYYEQLLLECNHHINSTEGHFFERSWYYIFE